MPLRSPAAVGRLRENSSVVSADVASVLLLLAFLFVLLHPSILNPFELEPHTAWTIHCYTFGVPILVINAVVRRRLWRLTPFDYLLLAYVACAVATWPTSFNRHTTAMAIVGLVGQLVVYAAVRQLAEVRPFLARVVIAALLVGIAMLEWTAAGVHLRVGLSARLVDYPPLDWNGREGLGLAAAIQFAFLVGIWQRARSSSVQLASIVLILGVVVEVLFLYSRLAWAAAAGVMAAAFITSVRLGGLRRYAVAMIVIGTLVGIVGTPYMAHLAKMATGLEHRGGESSLSFRVAAWLDTPRVMRGRILAGTGLGNYMAYRPTVDMPRSQHLPPGFPEPLHPHNAYLQQTAETGILGGLSYLAMWVTAIWAGWRISTRPGAELAIHSGLFLAVVAIAVSNLGENMFEGTERLRLYSIAWMVTAFVIAAWKPEPAARQAPVEDVV